MTLVSIQLLDPLPVDTRLYAYADTAAAAAAGLMLPDSRALGASIPAFAHWHEEDDPDTLFGQLGIDDFIQPGEAARTLRLRPREVWQALFQTPRFQAVFAPLLQHMGWYGAAPGEQASPRITQALAGRAIVEHFLGSMGGSREPMTRVVRRKWLYEYSALQLRGVIGNLLAARYPQASPAALGMLEYLLLRESLPELLVDGIPEHLQYGRSLQSVAWMHGVALAEAMVPGASALVGHDELAGLGATLALSTEPALQALWHATLVAPALHYAIAHGVVECRDDDRDQATAVQIRQAIDYLQEQQQAHARALNDLLALKAPDRRAMAEDMLRQAGVEASVWHLAADRLGVEDTRLLEAHGFTLAGSYLFDRLQAVGLPQATVVELVMMGEAYRAGQPTIAQAYDSAWQGYESALLKAQAAILRRLFTQMQPVQRRELLQSTCEISRVAFDDHEGRHGLFIRCQPGDHRHDFHDHWAESVFYEVFPAAGVIRRVDQRFDYHPAHRYIDSISLPALLHQKYLNEQRDALAPLLPLQAMDSDAYLDGAVSRAMDHLHAPRHGRLIPDPVLFYQAQATDQVALDALAAACARHLLAGVLQQDKAAHRHLTEWEQRWASERAWADTAARWLVPFYGCIRDLAAGEHSAGAVSGCVLDAAFTLVPLGLFARSTVRIILQAGEMSVVSLFGQAGRALERLASDLARQSGAFLLRDAARLAGRSRQAAAELLHDLPGLKAVFSAPGILNAVLAERGLFKALPQALHAVVDGRAGIAVRDIGTPAQPDYRLLDPYAGQVYGKPLSLVSRQQALELSTSAAAERIAPGHYPAVLPASGLADGGFELGIAQQARVRTLHDRDGVLDLQVDDQLYRLDTTARHVALRKLSADRLPAWVQRLERPPMRCRVRRELFSVPCAAGVQLATPAPVALADEATPHLGRLASHAMDARLFELHGLGAGGQSMDVFVCEGKFCQWVEQAADQASTSAQAQAMTGGTVLPLSDEALQWLWLPEQPVYRPALQGHFSGDRGLGLPVNCPQETVERIYHDCPVIRLEAIAEGVDDARSLRGIRLQWQGQERVMVEADTGIIYQAEIPADALAPLHFARVTDSAQLDEYLRLAEEYRLVREVPGIFQDQWNIARMLFDLGEEGERAAWPAPDMTFADYDRWCKDHQQENPLMKHAVKILSGKSFQDAYIRLAREAVPDFKSASERGPDEIQPLVDILNHLLPAQSSGKALPPLTVANIVQPGMFNRIRRQLNGANLAFASVYSRGRQSHVYFAVSGGEMGKNVRLRLERSWTTDAYINGVYYCDARPRAGTLIDPDAYRIPDDPAFTTLPTLRHADRLQVRPINRSLDSERLIGTMLKDELEQDAASVERIDFFTLLDACRSCGGFALPRLRRDFPQARFCVTYLKGYKDD